MPPAFVVRGIERVVGPRSATADIYPAPAPINALLKAVYRAEAAVASTTGLPFGLSLAALAVRR